VRWLLRYGFGLVLWLPGILNAQRVLYSESFHGRASDHFEIIGKSVNYYWVENRERQKSKYTKGVRSSSEILRFGLLDDKLNVLNEWPALSIPGTVKQWLMAGSAGLDQIVLTSSAGMTKIIRAHLPPNENAEIQSGVVDSLAFSANPSAFLLVRSEDQSKILLLAFENTATEFTRLHALLFNSEWKPIYHRVMTHALFAQPCIQDDEIGFTAESFDNLPVKLANNGEWLMATPSRISHNYSLFHACANGIDYSFREIPLSPYYQMEDIAMSIDNDGQEMTMGLLSEYSNTSLKNVQVCHYSMRQGIFDFDSSYHFNTQSRDIRDKNLSHERFISVPGGGYMLLKEYGSPFEFSRPSIAPFNELETAYLLANYSETVNEKEDNNFGYTLKHGLSPIPLVKNRGDLNLFYFPVISKDSVWSGVLSMEQHAELNNPDLSYLLVPAKNRLYIIYNSPDGFSDPLATTTTLNLQGQPTDDALVFWKMNKLLNFQRAHVFSNHEVAVPYSNAPGFAIIRLE
jgi:hypothetical protein